MKLLHLSERSSKGSAPSVHSQEVRRALRERGHTVYELDCAVSARSIPHRLWQSLLASLQLARQLRTQEVDVVYCRESWLDPFRTLCLQWCGVPWVVEINGLILDDLRKDGARAWLLALSRWAQGAALRKANGAFAACAAWRDRLRQDYNLPQLEVLQNGVFFDEFAGAEAGSAAIRDRLGLDGSHQVLGYIGNLGRYYDFFPVLDCMREVLAEHPQFRVVLVGAGPSEDKLRVRVKDLKLEPWVKFHGPIPHKEVPHWIQAFDIGWLPVSAPRVKETRGVLHAMKLAEYCAAGKPVLRVDYPGSDSWELLSDFSWGARPDGSDTLQMLLEALNCSARWPTLGQTAQEFARSRLSWNATMEKLERLLSHWIKSKP